ncbi:hypothetical protein EIN_094900 [Entamoeba invadens IP1]|uniref:Uncharacterized protein n=1 Tax=Entamoeba invadens IP1 TaxID=370355 RepID=A0A0A1U3C3_ENTIV|nr:hypothetical protein EIN_094900 [Entamoeba invadens IP1]ELP87253.1 hypothetical protein EIN_094900 [Entamoeba invadens IP1]|eukprot:XP_004254024.1 hypothetical protein EIN_094900 [Entamoeba invadens IP1]
MLVSSAQVANFTSAFGKVAKLTTQQHLLLIFTVVMVMFVYQSDNYFCVFQNQEQEWVSVVRPLKEQYGFSQFKFKIFTKDDLKNDFDNNEILDTFGANWSNDSTIFCFQSCGSLAVCLLVIVLLVF